MSVVILRTIKHFLNHKYFLIMTNTKNEWIYFSFIFCKICIWFRQNSMKTKNTSFIGVIMSVCQIIFLFIQLHYFILNKIQGILDWKACIMTFECVMTLTQHYLTKVKFTSSSHMVFIRGNQSFVYSSSCYSNDLQFILQIWMININYSRVSKSCNIIFSHSVLWNKHLKIIIRYPFFSLSRMRLGARVWW